MSSFANAVRFAVVGCFVVSCSIMFAWIAVQQDYRQSANDPQLQVATQLRDQLAHGAPPSQILGGSQAQDLSTDFNPFAIIYDSHGQPVASTVSLGGSFPQIDTGVFNYARTNGRDLITWEPRKGLREAIVVMYYRSQGQDGYVVVGRNLQFVEERESQLGNDAIYGLVASNLGVILLSLLVNYLGPSGPRGTSTDPVQTSEVAKNEETAVPKTEPAAAAPVLEQPEPPAKPVRRRTRKAVSGGDQPQV